MSLITYIDKQGNEKLLGVKIQNLLDILEILKKLDYEISSVKVA